MGCFDLEEDEGLSFSVGNNENGNNHELNTVFEEETQINTTDSKIVSKVLVSCNVKDVLKIVYQRSPVDICIFHIWGYFCPTIFSQIVQKLRICS